MIFFFFAYFVFTKLYVSFFYKMTINNFVLFIINVKLRWCKWFFSPEKMTENLSVIINTCIIFIYFYRTVVEQSIVL